MASGSLPWMLKCRSRLHPPCESLHRGEARLPDQLRQRHLQWAEPCLLHRHARRMHAGSRPGQPDTRPPRLRAVHMERAHIWVSETEVPGALKDARALSSADLDPGPGSSQKGPCR